ATVRLHISRMTCGSCPTTARLALKKLPGVYGATVTLDDSLGVVRYDPRQVTPDQIAAHLTRLTGFGATVQGKSACNPASSTSRSAVAAPPASPPRSSGPSFALGYP